MQNPAVRWLVTRGSWTPALFIVSVIRLLTTQTDAATNIVSTLADAGAGSLRQVIANSAADDVVQFGIAGTITLATGEIVLSRNLNIAGPGFEKLAISANHSSRVLSIQPGAAVLISGVTICNGQAPNGTNGVVVNWVPQPGGPGGSGGGILNAGETVLQSCRLMNNRAGRGGNGTEFTASASGGGPGGSGGAIFNTGSLTISNCLIETNRAGAGGSSGVATFTPPGGSGGRGGGICSQGTLVIHGSVVRENTAGSAGNTGAEASGAAGGSGGAVDNSGVLIATDSTFSGNRAGYGGNGGSDTLDAGTGGGGGSGGGLSLGSNAALTNCTIAVNSAGIGGPGGNSLYGTPGPGGPGGEGGGICSTGVVTLVNCTICSNSPGAGGPGGWRDPIVYPFPLFAPPGATGTCGGVTVTSSPSSPLLNSIISGNAGISPDISGTFCSLGHNLIGVTNGSSAFIIAGDLTGSSSHPLDACLAALANNGGPTPTIALLPASPALDAGAAAGAPPTDQRGLARPHGPGVDIGAYERQFDLPFIYSIALTPSRTCTLQLWGLPKQIYTLEESTNLTDWSDVMTRQTDAYGVFVCTNSSARDINFYRAHAPSD